MSNTTCPHYPPAGTVEPEVRCTGCGAIIVNPNSREAIQQGRVGPGKAAQVALPGHQSSKQKGRAEGRSV